MKFTKISCMSLSVALFCGCVYSHRNGVVYGPEPVVVTPTSEQPTVRVYPETPTVMPSTFVPVPATSTVAPGDLATAGAIRKMFEVDGALAAIARNVRITVLNGRVTLTGRVVTRNDHEALHSAINTTPGVSSVDDRLQIDLNR